MKARGPIAGRLKYLAFRLIRRLGLAAMARELVQRNRVTILMFHDIKPEAAEHAFGYLHKHYNLIGLCEYLRALDGRGSMPKKALVITFDDGHVGNYELLPLFAKWRIPVTIFLCAEIVATCRHYWFSYSHPDYSRAELKVLPNAKRLALLKEAGFEQQREYPRAQALSADQIRTMQEVGVVNFQSHTLFHPCLPSCSDDEARREVILAKRRLEEKFGLSINAFAYPNGDYTEREVELVKQAGYRCALTADPGFNTLTSDRYRLKRLSVNDAGNIDEVAVRASGVWALVQRLFRTR